MKIEDARVRYNVQIKTYYSKQKELYAQKQKLEEKIKTTENGAEVYKDESAILELQYNAVDEKRQEYQDYMDKLMAHDLGQDSKQTAVGRYGRSGERDEQDHACCKAHYAWGQGSGER